MSITIHSDRLPAVPDTATRVVHPDQRPTPVPLMFPFLRPPQSAGELGRIGGYRVFKLLGSGGMGKVFLAEDVGLKRDVALKVMCPPVGEDLLSWRERFLREARALAAITHQNLVGVYQVGEDHGTVFLAMELLEGQTLEARLRCSERLSVPEVFQLAQQIAEGLAAIHDRGLIHRDIKPGNIWLSSATQDTEPLEDEGAAAPVTQIKILDFGLVREVHGDTQLTEVGAVMGTPAYMSPEQVRGRGLDCRSDLFSFGCVLYAMCTGRPPFAADNPMAQAAALAADDPVRVRKLNRAVPRPLSDLIAELLAKEPADRPASAAAVVARLRAITAPAREEPQTRPPSFFRRNAGKCVVGIWLIVAALAATLALTWRTGPQPEPAGPEPEVVYLKDLATARAVDWPMGIPGRPYPPGVHGAVVVNGNHDPHGLFMHPAPPSRDPVSATYALDKGYARFVSRVALNDGPILPPPVRFAVYGDDQLLWQSTEITRQTGEQSCDVDVRDVRELRLEVLCARMPRGAHAVWLEPHLTK